MIPGEIGAEIGDALRAAVAAAELPAPAVGLTASGTWRPARVQVGGGPGSYATSLPFSLARLVGRDPGSLAALLAARLAAAPWISAARVTGGHYLTVTVTTGHLTGLAARIVAAGPAAVGSDALAGTRLTAPVLPDLAAELTWEQAWRAQHDALAGRLARVAGADVTFVDAQRKPAPGPSIQAGDYPASVPGADGGGEPVPRGGRGPVPDAVARYGVDAVRYALARTAVGAAEAIDQQLRLPMDLANPFLLVSYAHADAASTLRWAADLKVASGDQRGAEPKRPGRPAHASQPAGTASPQLAELVLLDAMSWLPERFAAATRRHRPAELAAQLEYLADAWLDCRESCPALPFGGRAAPADPSGAQAADRLELATATQVALSAGLTVLGVAAPARL